MNDIESAWQAALDLWGVTVRLSPPEPVPASDAAAFGGEEPLAYIDLESRQVRVNLPLLDRLGAAASLTAVLAHEVGHHVRFPHTLAQSARLDVLQKRLLPHYGHPLSNLFYDLLVNEVVGQTHADDLLAVYRGFVGTQSAPLTPMFAFYLALYEELWASSGSLVSADVEKRMEQEFPGFRAEARMFVQTFYALADPVLQFVYFCSRFARYLPAGADAMWQVFPMSADVPRPGPDDYSGALAGDPWAERALREAAQRGWIPAKSTHSSSGDPLGDFSNLPHGLAGNQIVAFREALADRIYRDLVEQHLVEVPALGERAPEALPLPMGAVPWEFGDDARDIDWVQSVITSGALAAALPQRRDLEIDPGGSDPSELPAVEIYLDTSGSMPNPVVSVNAMTLAAQVLAAATLRKGGRVRAAVYSSGPPLLSDWMYAEVTARRFLLSYSGGGTEFPFKRLATWCADTPRAIRVVISDSDFLYNVENTGEKPGPLAVLEEAARVSRVLVLLILAPQKQVRKVLRPLFSVPAFRLVVVSRLGDFAAMAAELARALLGEPMVPSRR